GIRQESYFLKVVVPFIEKEYPVQTEAGGRLLLGFSKSGWGAYAMLLRHPDLFGKAAAWDAPLMMEWPGKYGSVPIFGSAENFSRYQVSRLLEAGAPELRKGKRLILLGYGNFHSEHERAHAMMAKLHINHVYVDGPKREHTWGSGWLPEAVRYLFATEK
ncbi:MAG TPA: alpha/beta hydrolase-fold protein, partial [Tepidisphaeraceae bacterium]|nr:alpha/beta hydrolase-fold protein [Tepidisphaeraceae bacterium]